MLTILHQPQNCIPPAVFIFVSVRWVTAETFSINSLLLVHKCYFKPLEEWSIYPSRELGLNCSRSKPTEYSRRIRNLFHPQPVWRAGSFCLLPPPEPPVPSWKSYHPGPAILWGNLCHPCIKAIWKDTEALGVIAILSSSSSSDTQGFNVSSLNLIFVLAFRFTFYYNCAESVFNH